MKNLYLEAHEELIAEYLEAHPGVSESAAYDLTADRVLDRMREKYASGADYWRMAMKERA